ncbi:hypothetical protein FVEG_05660 [Fusarium verticillioides 7600]|uniref:Uncharacterized protein n=1 Tax=Gibberella moniliformis (strain M3125 / FGSC 7600) TaxID=334819 RepID=W7M139_GIBM7|nr:hypothetical protein FVEG_05660 [Fusarium verticillioides 7600]EWG44651.1 hypothetical protein FVEG_05660 [Fusarium verticillioides 7600]
MMGDDNQTGKSHHNILCNSRQSLYPSRNIPLRCRSGLLTLMPSNRCTDIDTTSNTAMTIRLSHR